MKIKILDLSKLVFQRQAGVCESCDDVRPVVGDEDANVDVTAV